MNPHSRSLFTLPIHAWFGFVSFTNLMVRKRCLLSLLVAGITALVVVLMATQPISPASAHPAQPAPHTARLPQPNIVFIITDDQDTETLKYMPRVKRLLADEGISFTNMFVTTPQCCPSHVTILTGKYPHNSGVLNNWFDSGGGFQTFVNNGGDKSTIATWLQAAGYRTARFGKYLVEYDNTTYIPPGWSEWYAYYGSGKYFNYTLNENGTRVAYGNAPSDYSTDVLTEKVIDFIGRTEENEPFFVFFAPAAPHGDGVPNGPATPAPRHKGMFAGTQAPRTPSFNEADVSDKPPAISSLPLLTAAQITAIDSEYQTRLESLQSVDEAVESIVNKLAALGQLENTYVIFTSDNGYHLGQHRLRNGKTQVYEEDIRVPLIVRGPKAPVATTRDHLVVTIDFAPTLAKLAHVQPDHTVDGQSFVDLFDDHPPSPKEWRKDFLLEVYRRLPPLGNGDAIRALRSLDGLLYVEYDSGPRELYDLTQDPYELESQHDVAPPGHLKKLSRRLAELATCAGHTCQEPTWSATGSLGTARLQHTATLLANGKVLVVGGVIRCNPGCSTTGSAELYDPATGTWSYTGNLNTARRLHTATLLANGQVLVAGGTSGKDVLNSAELYDPATGTWSSTGNLNTARDGHTATLLSTGKVLVAGGGSNNISAELYDPATGRWRYTGNLNTARGLHTATLLPNGKVLVVGNASPSARNSAESYDPATETWSLTGHLNTGRWYAHTATLLANGQVLVAAGSIGGDDVLESVELYDPVTGIWSHTSDLSADRGYHTATLLANGKVLVAGGFDYDYDPLNSVELYDPATGSWSATSSLITARSGHTATLLANGKVLVVGGDSGGILNSAELFDSGTATLASVSAASFALGTLAPESIAAAFGANLATGTQPAPSLPLPTQLAGVSVKVRDSAGAERAAPLFFVSPGQINYQVPPGTAAGPGLVTVTSGESIVAAGLVEIAGVAPGLFSANQSGQGVAAALAFRLKADGTQQFEPVARFDSTQHGFVAEPIDLGPESDQVFLVLFGTGIKFRSALSTTSATIGGASSQVLFADAAPGFVGLDQVNVRLPRSLAGRGEVEVVLSVDGRTANTVRVSIR